MPPPFVGLSTFLNAPRRDAPPAGPLPTAILGLPFDQGTSFRPGARLGPAAIRQMSGTLCDDDHPELGVSPADRLALFDAGDVVPVTGDLTGSLAAIEDAAGRLIGLGAHLVALGGDHTVSLPLLRATARRHGRLALVQFDAHPDTWDGAATAPIYHGSPFRHAIADGLIDPSASVQIGLRAPVLRAVRDWTRATGMTGIAAEQVHLDGIVDVVEQVRGIVGDRPAYLSFDIDCLDPSHAPGTATPEIGGLFSWQALGMVKRLAGLNWVGMDVVEIVPPYDHAGITALAAATMAWTYLCARAARAYPVY